MKPPRFDWPRWLEDALLAVLTFLIAALVLIGLNLVAMMWWLIRSVS